MPEDIAKAFGQQLVSFGGMVRRLQYIHDIPEVGGTPIPGCRRPLYAGGKIGEGLRVLREQRVSADRFKVYVGCCVWEEGQLESELVAGYWVPVAAEADALLGLLDDPDGESSRIVKKHTTTDASPSSPAQDETSPPRASEQSLLFGADVPLQQYSGPNIWKGILASLGEPFAAMSLIPNWVRASAVESLDWQ
jgi:hypothetical protein